MASQNTGLKIIIVGSGLAGLTAARILREHHRVTVYERGDAAVATGGQGIIMTPNSVKILGTIGFDREKAGSVPIYGMRTYNKHGAIGEDVNLDLKHRFGDDSLAQKRSDFRKELVRLATAPSIDLGIIGDPANVITRTTVTGLDPENGIVTMDSGSTESADVVIVADGIYSRLRSSIIGNNDFDAKKTGLTCYRIAMSTLDAKTAVGDLALPHWWDPRTSQNRTSIIAAADGTGRMITAYPICDQEAFNLSCIVHTDHTSKSTTESWHADGDRSKLVEDFRDFDESLVKIIGAAKEVKQWELQDLDPIPRWTRGRAMLIGDAAHAMTPMQGQGANMSIEDAESLRLLGPNTRREDVAKVLKVAESVRKPRLAEVLEQTRKAHSGVGVAERSISNMEFNCSYNGIFDALAKREGGSAKV